MFSYYRICSLAIQVVRLCQRFGTSAAWRDEFVNKRDARDGNTGLGFRALGLGL